MISLIVVITCLATSWTAQATDSYQDYDRQPHYTSTWAVEIDGGEEIANEIAQRHGFINRGKIDALGEVYEFELKETREVSRSSPYTAKSKHLSTEPSVRFIEQQIMEPLDANSYQVPEDPLFSSQWQLVNTGQLGSSFVGNDLRVEQAWLQGLTGCNVTVTVVDDGVDFRHPDLWDNYALRASFDNYDKDNDPYDSYDTHGTNVAGVVGAARDNNTCGVGIAHQVNLGGIRLSIRFATDLAIARSLSYSRDVVDIYSNSWSPSDNGRNVGGPRHLTEIALKRGVQEGRDGKGSIFVFGSGNGGRLRDDCGANGFASSIYTISIGAIGVNGTASDYDEACSTKMAMTYVTNHRGQDSVSTTHVRGECLSDFGGTSAAAPMATGIIALALQANPSLTWRDVQYLIVYTSNPNKTAGPLTRNGAGLAVSRQYGFGVMDSEAMVTRARHWINVPPQINDSLIPHTTSGLATFQSPHNVRVNYDGSIEYLEQVIVRLSLEAFGSGNERRGDIVIELVSPQGTRSTLINYRPSDGPHTGPVTIFSVLDSIFNPVRYDYSNWPFTSVMFWGEDPAGEWTLTIRSVNNQTSINITDIQFQFFGVSSIPEAVANIPQQCHSDCSRGCARNGSEFCDSCVNLRNAYTLECIDQCPSGYTEHNGYCYDSNLPTEECYSPLKFKEEATCKRAGYTDGCCIDEFCKTETELNSCFCDVHCHTYGDCCSDIADIGCTPQNDTELCGILPFIPLGETEGVESHVLHDAVSNPINVTFPFGNNTIKSKVQIAQQGYFSFDGFNGTTPFLFNGSHSIVAPYFHSYENGDRVDYEIHTPDTSEEILSDVNELIRNCTGKNFKGRWLLSTTWNIFGLETEFQGLLITDFANSYAVFTYSCYSTSSGLNDVVIGFSSDDGTYVNHEASFRPRPKTLTCSNYNYPYGTKWANVIYQLSDNENECEVDNGGCEQVCVDTFESYKCVCEDGYTLNNETGRCQDIDECSTTQHGCSHSCMNTIGSYICSCPDSHTLHDDNRLCLVNECEVSNGGCEQICNDTLTSFECSCQKGFSLKADNISCQDINECLAPGHDCEQTCINTNGSYMCSCDDGYALHENNYNCTDIDECSTSEHGCEDVCVNVKGSYHCDCRNEEFALNKDGKTCSIPCGGYFTQSNGTFHTPSWPHRYPFHDFSCEWIIEMKNTTTESIIEISFDEPFGINGRSPCPSDYVEIMDGVGEDATSMGRHCFLRRPDPILTSSSRATVIFQGSSHSRPQSRVGVSISYKLIPKVNECEVDNGGCAQICSDSLSGYSCSCNEGFVLASDKHTCNDINECSTNRHGCEETCINSEGSYSCDCREGYALGDDERSCVISCGGQLTESAGSFQTPDWPVRYPQQDFTCVWTFNMSASSTIQFTVDSSSYGINGRPPCPNDHLEFFDGLEADSVSLGKFCKLTLPPPITTSTGSAKVVFVGRRNSHRPLSRKGVKVFYTVNE